MQHSPTHSLSYRPGFIRIFIFGIALALSLFIHGCSQAPAAAFQPPPLSLPVATLAFSTDTTYQEYPVSIEGLVDVEVRPQVPGTLDRVFVDEGQYVNAGTSLFKINDLPYQAALNNALAAQHAAEAAAANAQLEIDKLAPLVENKVVADYQLKTAQSAYDVAKANIEEAKANVATAQINLGYTTIKAPVNGYIGRLERKQGSLVAPGDPVALTQLSDVQNVHVYFSLSEDDFVQFKAQYPGNTLAEKIKHVPAVQLILSDRSTYGQTGHLDIFDGQFDKSTGAITVRATFANPQGLLRAGNTGRLRLSLSHPNSLAIPQSATMELQDKIYAFKLIDSNKVSKTPLTVIGKTGRNYLISEGLKPGDRIVLTNLDRLQDGIIIQPVNPATNTATK